MKSMEELDGTPVERKDGEIVIPEGYMIAPKHISDFEGLICYKSGVTKWVYDSSWEGSSSSFVYIIPDPNYTPTKKEDDVVLEAFNATIKDLEEELQDVRTAKEAYLRLCKDAETFAAIADKYGWFEKEEEGVEVPKPVEPEFKVGDKVRIKKDADKIAPHNTAVNFVDTMYPFLSKEMIIQEESSWYKGWFDGGTNHWWSKNWLEKVEE